MPRILAKFNTKTGKVTVETEGFLGKSCKEGSKFLEEALGQAQSETLKQEFFAHQQTGQTVDNQMVGG